LHKFEQDMATTYDTISYPTVPRALAHPGHLHAVAMMYGLAPSCVERARVLEIGCGDGGNLLACAAALPDAKFTGFDLSSVAIARGQTIAADAGLENAHLAVGDITNWQPDGTFDYIIVDGIYSWVPTPVRNALIDLIGRALAPNGLAFISYNVYPGCYTRRMLWEMMRFHVRGIDDPERQIDESLRMADFLRVSRSKVADPVHNLFDRDIENVLNKRVRNILFHDELSPVNEPVYIHQFERHLRSRGLRFVSESLPQSMGFTTLAEPIREKIRTFAGGDPIKREQYLDFATLRRFRQSLVARAETDPRDVPDPNAIRELYFGGVAKPGPVDLAPGTAMTFTIDETTLTIHSPLAKAALLVLSGIQPKRMTFAELLASSHQILGRASSTDEEVKELLNDISNAWLSGAIILKGNTVHYADSVSERPVAHALARAQLRHSPTATSLLHTTIQFDDPPSRRLVQLLDGSRTVDQVAAELLPIFPPENRPPPELFRAGLDRNLAMLAANGFLAS
jgi:SAM-dependent methyltransferase/methyltransferase-like protein